MGPRYPCKEHSDFHAARDRQKHLNMLLMDYCIEYERTYFPDGKPRPVERKKTFSVEDPEVEAAKLAKSGKQLTNKPTKIVWTSVYKEGGPEAAQTCMKVNNRRTPSGNFFGLVNPGLPREDLTLPIPNKVQDNIQKEALIQSGRCPAPTEPPKVTFELPKSTKVGQHGHSGRVGDAPTTEAERASRSWLMPHQTGNRKLGMEVAKHINCSRTPSGGFATFDLAKAPK